MLQLLALDLSNPVKASDTPKAEPLQINELEAQRLALEHQPDYLSQVIAGEQAEINLTVARNNSLWDVSLVGGANQARDQFSGGYEGRANRNWQSYAGIQIEVPIGNPPRAKAKCRRKSTWTPRLSASRKRSSNWSARWQMRSAMYGRAGASTRLPGAHATCRERNWSLNAKLQAGRSSNFQVLSFETDLRNAENARLNALIGYLNAQTELDQRLGMTLKSWDIALND